MATVAKRTKKIAAPVVEAPVVVAYKAFDKNWKCRDFQYEVGKTYTHEGEVKACQSGFHACENPLDIFNYYSPGDAQFAVVEVSGELSRHDGDSKIAAGKITIKAELKIPALVEKTIAWIAARCAPADARSATGDQSASSATGYGSVAMSIGYGSRSCAGEGGAIVCVYRDDSWNLAHIRASKVGDNGIKPDTFYTLDAQGEFKEVA